MVVYSFHLSYTIINCKYIDSVLDVVYPASSLVYLHYKAISCLVFAHIRRLYSVCECVCKYSLFFGGCGAQLLLAMTMEFMLITRAFKLLIFRKMSFCLAAPPIPDAHLF